MIVTAQNVRAGSPERLSVLRHAFAAHDAAIDRLADIVTAVGDGHVAVSHRASDPTTRIIVDEYQRGSDGHYQLQVVGTELCRCASLTLQQIRLMRTPCVPFCPRREIKGWCWLIILVPSV